MIFQALIAFALAFGILAPLQAQPASGAATAPGSADTATGIDAAKDLPSDAALLREHLAQGEQAPPGQGGRSQSLQRAGPTTPANNADGNSGPRAAQDVREQGGIANAVKDWVRPLHQEIRNSSVVQVVREIDAAVGATSQADTAQQRPGYAPRGTAAPGTAPGTAQGNRELDPHAVSLMWQELLEEVVPWALAGALVAMLAYAGYFWMKVIKFKSQKQGNKRRDARKSGRRLSRRSHSAAVVESASDEMASLQPVARLRKSSSDGSDRSSRRGSNREPGREPGRSSRQSASRVATHKPDGAIR